MKFRTLLVIFILKLHTQLFYCEGSNGLVDQNGTSFPRVIDLGGGKFDFGGLLIDQKLKRLSFDAVCNQTSGLVEYALVHQSGKLHESLFSTKIPPRWIHACLLLLKAKPLGGNFLSQEFKSQQAEDMIPEYQMNAQVSWEENESIITREIFELVFNQLSERTLEARPFLFTGSRTIEGNYMAVVEGSILAIYHDRNAIINSLDPESISDDSWVVFHEKMPPLDQRVRFYIQVLAGERSM